MKQTSARERRAEIYSGGAWRLGVHGYTWFERRAMQVAVGRGVRWRACSFADRAIALAPCARHEHATGFERLGRQCVANGSSTSESGTRGTGAGSVNESSWAGARRARAAGKHPPGYCSGTWRSAAIARQGSAFELNADFEIIRLIGLISDY